MLYEAPIPLVPGDDWDFEIQTLDENGDAVDLTGFTVLERNITGRGVVFDVTVALAPGSARITCDHSLTAALKLGNVSTLTIKVQSSDQTQTTIILKEINGVEGIQPPIEASTSFYGLQGRPGATMISGDGSPSDNAGNNSDTYINRTNGGIWAKANGAWADTGNSIFGTVPAETQAARDAAIAAASASALSAASAAAIAGGGSYQQEGAGSVQQSVAARVRGTITAGDFGLVGDGTTNNLTALTNALAAARTYSRPITLPVGTFNINAAAPDFTLFDHLNVDGHAIGKTIFKFTGLSTSSHGFAATNKTGIKFRNLTIMSSTALSGNQDAVLFYECNDCLLENVEQRNFSAGLVFDGGTAPTTSTPTWGNRNKAINCYSNVSRSYGFFSQAQNGTLWIGCEATGATNQDGFKTGRGNRAHRIDSCYSHGNNADGFDTYDGFIDSAITNCISENNGAGGYQFKGTLDGSYSAGDYVTRDSVISNCVARGNGINGFLFQEVRSLVIANLMSVENTGFGYCFNNVQGCAVDNIHALRNTTDGVNVQGSSSRNRFRGIIAMDNSYVDGVTQNGTYHGVNMQSGSNNFFSGIQANIGTQTGKLGGQGYGIFTGTTAGNSFTDYWCSSNVTGDVGGTNPYINNTFGATIGGMKMRRGTGSPESVVTGAVGDMYLRSDGGASTCLYVKESGTGATGWVAK